MAVTSNTGTFSPTKTTETTIATLSGGPFDLLSVFAQGGQTPDAVGRVAYRLYAVVGGLRSLIAESVVIGNATASILQWQAPGSGASASQFVEAGGDSYVLTVQQVPGSSVQVAAAATATIAGVDKLASTTDTNVASTVNVLPYSETSTGAVNGYAQFMDVGVNQAGLPRTTSVIVYASCGGGSVEAIVKQDALGGPDGTTAVIRRLALPVATSYRVGVRNQDARAVSVPTSIATYSEQVTNVSPSALTPGPQLTVLRSTPATAPTTVVWASTGYVDFVADCGADPTGAVDCAPAWERARQLLTALAADPRLPLSSLTLFFPPGVYSQNSALVNQVWNFNLQGTSLTFRGAGVDTSIIQYNGFDGPVIANVFTFFMSDLSFVGAQVQPALDVVTGLEVSVSYVGLIERCHFNAILSASGVLFLLGATWSIRDCTFTDVSCTNAALGCVYSKASYIELVSVNFIDIDTLNGYPNVNKTSVNRCWFRHDDTPTTPGSGYEQRGVYIRGCIFDESCERNVAVVGGPTGNVSYVRVEATMFNPPILGTKIGCVYLEKVDVVDLVNVMDSADLASDPLTPILNLVNVGKTRARSLRVGPGQSNFVVTDAACKFLRIEDTNITPANIFDGTAGRALAKTIQVQAFGTDTEVECAIGVSTGAAIAVGSVVKLAPTGYAPIAVTDGVALAAYVSLDAVAGGPAGTLRAAKRGQIVTVLSDGTTAIAIGDPITNLGAAAAGQVKKSASTGTTPTIGIATSPAASGGGAVLFNMLFQTGEA